MWAASSRGYVIGDYLRHIVSVNVTNRTKDVRGQPDPINTPALNTSAPPSTTWNAARKNGVSM